MSHQPNTSEPISPVSHGPPTSAVDSPTSLATNTNPNLNPNTSYARPRSQTYDALPTTNIVTSPQSISSPQQQQQQQQQQQYHHQPHRLSPILQSPTSATGRGSNFQFPPSTPTKSYQHHLPSSPTSTTTTLTAAGLPAGVLRTSGKLLICTACGTQYDTACPASVPADLTFIPPGSVPLKSCRVCDDPRQYVPPGGQRFTTLERMRRCGKFRNLVQRHWVDSRVWEIWTEEKFGIGQRAILIRTPYGNVLWDLIAYLDQSTVNKLNELGGIKFIVISHPHFYTTWADWSATFNCPVYLSSRDAHDWANRTSDLRAQLKLLKEQHTELLPGLTAVIAGGHFPGSMFLHSSVLNTSAPSLFVADTIMAVPAGRNPDPGKPGVNSYAFMWSIPNMIPLPAAAVLEIWLAIKPYEFEVTYGNMKEVGEVRENPEHRMTLKRRVLESAKIHCQHAGYQDHPIFAESC